MFIKKCIDLENSYTKNDYDLNIKYHFCKFVIELFSDDFKFILDSKNELTIKLKDKVISMEEFKYYLQMTIYFEIIEEFKGLYFEHEHIYKQFRDDNGTRDIDFETAKPLLERYLPDLTLEKDPRGEADEYGWTKYTWFSIIVEKYPKFYREDLVKSMQLIKGISNKIQYDDIRDYLLSKNKFENL
jgi:hypothetical protein